MAPFGPGKGRVRVRKRFLLGLAAIAVVIWGPIILWFGFDLGHTVLGKAAAIRSPSG